MSRSESVTAAVLGKTFTCRLCHNPKFAVRKIKLNTTYMELFDFGWANLDSTG